MHLCLQHPEAGLGLFASDGIWKPLHVSWWKRLWYSWQKPNDGIILASFPLQAAVTPQTILADPVLGSAYQELVSIGKMLMPVFKTENIQLNCILLPQGSWMSVL